MVCPHTDRFVAQAQVLAHLRGSGQRAQKRQSPPLPRPRDGHHHRQHDESRKPGLLTDRFRLDRALPWVMPPFVDLRAPAPFQGFVDHDIQRSSGLDQGFSDQGE